MSDIFREKSNLDRKVIYERYISPEDKPQLIIGPDIARVLVRPDDIIEIYGHGALAQAQILNNFGLKVQRFGRD